ncbi:MAG TPA: YCF48-related protein [Nitrosopumilaceae archaeon]|jgi:photosystem II stability/assembly factor-like uncharacterized protein|nr:YCF48-related protein [Nitrosopumilaceae archaeon]
MRIKLLFLITLSASTSFAQWNNLSSGTLNWLRGVWFTHVDTGFAIGYNGTILKTTDGGLSWNLQTSNLTNNLQGIFFINSLTGWVVGDSGTILKTSNGGLNWIKQTSTTTAILHKPFFVDPNNGYIAGEGGTCLKTVNGGLTWSNLTVTTGNGKVSLFFNNLNVGYVSGLGFSDAIIKTTNGGSTWANIYTNNIEEFSSIYFTSLNDGFAVSSSTGKITSTHNAGFSWNTQSFGASSLYSVQFPSALIGYAVGGYPSNGTILSTTNSGSNWSPQNSNTSQPLFDVFFVNNSIGYAVGKNGTIIKTINAGVGIKEYVTDNSFSIYPNPATTELNFELSFNKEDNFSTLEIYDISGKNVYIDEMKRNAITLNTTGYNSGIYTAVIRGNGILIRKNFVIN